MPPPLDERFVEESARALGLDIRPEWRAAVAEHYRRLLDAVEVMESSKLPDAEPATRFEP